MRVERADPESRQAAARLHDPSVAATDVSSSGPKWIVPKCARRERIHDHSSALQRTMTESTSDFTASISTDFRDQGVRTENP